MVIVTMASSTRMMLSGMGRIASPVALVAREIVLHISQDSCRKQLLTTSRPGSVCFMTGMSMTLQWSRSNCTFSNLNSALAANIHAVTFWAFSSPYLAVAETKLMTAFP